MIHTKASIECSLQVLYQLIDDCHADDFCCLCLCYVKLSRYILCVIRFKNHCNYQKKPSKPIDMDGILYILYCTVLYILLKHETVLRNLQMVQYTVYSGESTAEQKQQSIIIIIITDILYFAYHIHHRVQSSINIVSFSLT
jgi:hypothetical protein